MTRVFLSKYLLRIPDYYEGQILHFCPACDDLHPFAVDKPFRNGSRWTFDGNPENPTFAPSMNIRTGPYNGGKKQGKTDVCHYFLKEGRIQYLDDCTHALRGQTVDLPPVPEKYRIMTGS